MVVGRFRRTLSFPNPNQNPNPSSKSYHIRSVSLPCRSHPLIRQLRDEITSLQTWHHHQQQQLNTTSSTSLADHHHNTTKTTAWVPDALTRLKTIHDTLDDILQLPQTRDCLASDRLTIENLLEDYLRFADVYGIFQSCIVSFKEEVLSSQIAIRRRRSDDKSSSSTSTRALTEFVLKARKKTGKQLTKLVSTVRSIDRRQPATKEEERRYRDTNDEELRVVIKQVHDLTVLISVSLFDGLLLSLKNSVGKGSGSWAADLLWYPMKKAIIRKTQVVIKTSNYNKLQSISKEDHRRRRRRRTEEEEALLEKMVELEDSLSRMETGSHNVFRTLISTRVSLLNILTTH